MHPRGVPLIFASDLIIEMCYAREPWLQYHASSVMPGCWAPIPVESCLLKGKQPESVTDKNAQVD